MNMSRPRGDHWPWTARRALEWLNLVDQRVRHLPWTNDPRNSDLLFSWNTIAAAWCMLSVVGGARERENERARSVGLIRTPHHGRTLKRERRQLQSSSGRQRVRATRKVRRRRLRIKRRRGE